ncbi:hypothetical protein GCM10027590_32900 [Nocardiopsis nanhaiensis]
MLRGELSAAGCRAPLSKSSNRFDGYPSAADSDRHLVSRRGTARDLGPGARTVSKRRGESCMSLSSSCGFNSK